VWPTINIPTPFGGTPLYENCLADDRILKKIPFAFYYNPYLVIQLANYHPIEYYEHLIDISSLVCSKGMLMRRVRTQSRPAIRFVHGLRALSVRQDLEEYRRIRTLLTTDAQFRAFHEGRSDVLPEFYHWQFERRLGHYAELLTREERMPYHHEPFNSNGSAPAFARESAVGSVRQPAFVGHE
jgi:hypothetical protein